MFATVRADKRAEAERLERESRRQARRDEEMRELAIKLRRKSVYQALSGTCYRVMSYTHTFR